MMSQLAVCHTDKNTNLRPKKVDVYKNICLHFILTLAWEKA